MVTDDPPPGRSRHIEGKLLVGMQRAGGFHQSFLRGGGAGRQEARLHAEGLRIEALYTVGQAEMFACGGILCAAGDSGGHED